MADSRNPVKKEELENELKHLEYTIERMTASLSADQIRDLNIDLSETDQTSKLNQTRIEEIKTLQNKYSYTTRTFQKKAHLKKELAALELPERKKTVPELSEKEKAVPELPSEMIY